jgi:hypothetical protein
MIVRIQAGGIANPPEIKGDVDALVISTDDGDPILAAFRMKNATVIQTAKQEGFLELLKLLGYDESDLPKVEQVDLEP